MQIISPEAKTGIIFFSSFSYMRYFLLATMETESPNIF